MDNKLLLTKSISLLYRESQLPVNGDSSSDLIRTVLDNIQVTEISLGMGSEREVINNLKATILEMCNNPSDQGYDSKELLQRVMVNCGTDDRLYEAIRQGIDGEMADAAIKRFVVSTRKSIMNHFRDQKIDAVLSKAANDWRFRRSQIKDASQFLAEHFAQLEPLQNSTNGKDAAVMGELDIGDEGSTRHVFEQALKQSSGEGIYRFGWQGLNEMTQGGIRPGETMVVGALQHKYKTGFTLSVFSQIALFNKPHMPENSEGKKPVLLRISFEDDLKENLQFIYQYLKYNETRAFVDIRDATVDEMTTYVKEKLMVNGFHIKMSRVDPTQWTYRSICNKVIELEAQGYVVIGLMVDYLSKVPTTGCINTGPMGNDMMDMLSRVRNFCAAKGIFFITPHQLSTDAKNLLRTGVSDEYFTREVAEKGYWEFTKGLDRIFDLGVIIHLVKYRKKTYLSVARDKHRISTIVEDAMKHFFLEFPWKMPIPHDVDDTPIHMRKLPTATEDTSDALFDN